MLIALGFAVVWLILGFGFWFFNIRNSTSSEIEKRLLRNPEHCNSCNQNYYMCPICGCQYNTQFDADHCRNWCKILGRDRHTHTNIHIHEDEQ